MADDPKFHDFPSTHEDGKDDIARLAAIFAADCNTDAVRQYSTDSHAAIAIAVAKEAEKRRLSGNYQNFYRVDFVEAAAEHFNRQPASQFATIDEHVAALVEAGQLESDSLL